MRRNSDNSKGFALVEVLVILAVVVVVGVAGFIAYDQHHNGNGNKSSTASGTTTPNPYAGWATGSLRYEKATFKYPASWQISNASKSEEATGGTVTPGSDVVALTSPTGLIVSINTGVAGIGDSDGIDSVLPGAQPITALGGSYYLAFFANNSGTPSGDAQGACLNGETSAPGTPYIASKNIHLANTSGVAASPAANLVCIKYADIQGELPQKPVATFEEDPSFNDAKLIIESLAY